MENDKAESAQQKENPPLVILPKGSAAIRGLTEPLYLGWKNKCLLSDTFSLKQFANPAGMPPETILLNDSRRAQNHE